MVAACQFLGPTRGFFRSIEDVLFRLMNPIADLMAGRYFPPSAARSESAQNADM